MISNTQESDSSDTELVEALTRYLTPSIEQVADWHFSDATLHQDWDRPLVRVLRFFVGDAQLGSPLEDEQSLEERELCGSEPQLIVVSDALVDARCDYEQPCEFIRTDGLPAIAA